MVVLKTGLTGEPSNTCPQVFWPDSTLAASAAAARRSKSCRWLSRTSLSGGGGPSLSLIRLPVSSVCRLVQACNHRAGVSRRADVTDVTAGTKTTLTA